jgi:hypothetical protein
VFRDWPVCGRDLAHPASRVGESLDQSGEPGLLAALGRPVVVAGPGLAVAGASGEERIFAAATLRGERGPARGLPGVRGPARGLPGVREPLPVVPGLFEVREPPSVPVPLPGVRELRRAPERRGVRKLTEVRGQRGVPGWWANWRDQLHPPLVAHPPRELY